MHSRKSYALKTATITTSARKLSRALKILLIKRAGEQGCIGELPSYPMPAQLSGSPAAPCSPAVPSHSFPTVHCSPIPPTYSFPLAHSCSALPGSLSVRSSRVLDDTLSTYGVLEAVHPAILKSRKLLVLAPESGLTFLPNTSWRSSLPKEV